MKAKEKVRGSVEVGLCSRKVDKERVGRRSLLKKKGGKKICCLTSEEHVGGEEEMGSWTRRSIFMYEDGGCVRDSTSEKQTVGNGARYDIYSKSVLVLLVGRETPWIQRNIEESTQGLEELLETMSYNLDFGPNYTHEYLV